MEREKRSDQQVGRPPLTLGCPRQLGLESELTQPTDRQSGARAKELRHGPMRVPLSAACSALEDVARATRRWASRSPPSRRWSSTSSARLDRTPEPWLDHSLSRHKSA